jgi:sialate O-acetylesterase
MSMCATSLCEQWDGVRRRYRHGHAAVRNFASRCVPKYAHAQPKALDGHIWFLRAVFALFMLCSSLLHAELRLPHVLSNHMVVQREQPIHVWGWASPGAQIAVTLGHEHLTATADDLNHWSVYLPPMPAGGPYAITVEGDGGQIMLEDVLVGDVWIASGQSNMEMPLGGFGPKNPITDGEATIAHATDAKIRLLIVPRVSSNNPLDDTAASWVVCSPESARKFSAVAYFFVREIRSLEKAPIGVVDSTWGGTPGESWVSLPALASDANLAPVFQEWARFMDEQTDLTALRERERREDEAARAASAPLPKHTWHPDPMSYAPAGLFNGMIAPLTKMSIKGVIWYQGETNSKLARAPLYERVLSTLIADWREQWRQGDFPFLYAQISSFRSDATEAWGVLRDAQRRTLFVRNTGMAVTIDVGNPDDVHPADKETVGHRLALLAEDIAYGKRVNASGPLFLRADIEGASVRLRFSSKDLVCKSPCAGFELAGEDHHFVPAETSVQGDSLLVSTAAITRPVYVRYAWANAPVASLFNSEGLPASTFTSETQLAGQMLIPSSYGQIEP